MHAGSETEVLELRRTSPDWVDQAADLGMAALLLRLSERERRELGEIDAALERIDDGTFGVCQDCGGPIGRGRLRAVPEARRCVGCSA